MKKKIVTILGARPQFIKASALSAKIIQHSSLTEIAVHTGQHFDKNMSDVFFQELDMRPPKYHLGIHGGTHAQMTGRMLMTIEHVMLEEKPDIALVYGDTNSTLAGALAASKLHIPVAHVEAGLRSFNMSMPEEINRIVTDRISSWLFTPTQTATDNLRKEGASQAHIAQTGDIMYDVALNFADKVSADGRLLSELRLKPRRYILATIHRAENTDSHERLSQITDYLQAVSTTVLPIVWPLHPRTRKSLEDAGLLGAVQKSIILVPPAGYLDMVQLEKYSALVITDSGGVQKEAFFYEVPCITLRDQTEWTELVDSGWNYLVPPLSGIDIAETVRRALSNKPKRTSPYGDGDAARKIVSILAGV